MIFNLVYRIFVYAMHIPKRKAPRELNFAVKQKDGWAVTCGSCVIYHFLEEYFDMKFNLRHQLPSLKKKTTECLFSTIPSYQLSGMKLIQNAFMIYNFKNNALPQNSNIHMYFSDLLKKQFLLLS